MPELKYRPPRYRHHKASGQAIVSINGRDYYLGLHGSAGSREKYDQLIAEWYAAKVQPPSSEEHREAERQDLRICELLASYFDFARGYYVKNGRLTGEYTNLEHATRPLVDLFARLPIPSFKPASLKAVRDRMVAAGLSRKVINSRINRIRRIFKWGVENEFVEPSVLQAIAAIAPLKAGRTTARECSPVRPVAEDHVTVVLPLVSRQIRAMIELQTLTGMRPGEVVIMRTCDLDMAGKTWCYRPSSHKTEHHGFDRIVYVGPKAQVIVRPFLTENPQAYLFSPRDARLDLINRRAVAAGKKPRLKLRWNGTKKAPGEHYTSESYCYAIHQACKKAGIPVWSPNRLRHNAATFLRKEYGIEEARVILGHRSAQVTEVYAELDRSKAADIMGEVG